MEQILVIQIGSFSRQAFVLKGPGPIVGPLDALEGPLGGLTTLHWLNLSSNVISGTLPSSWTFPEMRVLNLSSNIINGTLPSGALWALVMSQR